MRNTRHHEVGRAFASLGLVWRAVPSRLRWPLGLTVAISALVLLLPVEDAPPAQTEVSWTQDAQSATSPQDPSVVPSRDAGSIWKQYVNLPRASLEAAEHDPFAIDVPKSPVPQAAAPVATPSPAQAFVGPPEAPPPPPPPAPQFRVLGWLQSGVGTPQLFVTNGQIDLPVRPGLILPDGFVVQQIDAQALQLLHPPTKTRYALPLPASLSPALARAATNVENTVHP